MRCRDTRPGADLRSVHQEQDPLGGSHRERRSFHPLGSNRPSTPIVVRRCVEFLIVTGAVLTRVRVLVVEELGGCKLASSNLL